MRFATIVFTYEESVCVSMRWSLQPGFVNARAHEHTHAARTRARSPPPDIHTIPYVYTRARPYDGTCSSGAASAPTLKGRWGLPTVADSSGGADGVPSHSVI